MPSPRTTPKLTCRRRYIENGTCPRWTHARLTIFLLLYQQKAQPWFVQTDLSLPVLLHLKERLISNMTDNTPIPDLTVETVRIVAHTMGPVAPGAQLSQNHWSIYLVVGESASVRLNMIPSTKEGDDKGIFHVTRHLYTLTNSAVRYFDFGVANKMIVRQVLDLIASKKRHQYIMTPTGVGCRHWV